jgi:PadR family transcriptional regulator, regulatory protein PadR
VHYLEITIREARPTRCSTGRSNPALHRLEERGWVAAKWETAPDRNREFKYYRLTEKGRKQLVVEESQWKQMAEAVARVMWPAAEEG